LCGHFEEPGKSQVSIHLSVEKRVVSEGRASRDRLTMQNKEQCRSYGKAGGLFFLNVWIIVGAI
jgi:hypothetical protein